MSQFNLNLTASDTRKAVWKQERRGGLLEKNFSCWKSTVIPSPYTRHTMFLWTEDFKLRLGKHCFMCWTPKKGLSASVTWLAILTKEAELSKHQSIFHQLPISAGQSEQEGSKEQLRTGLISFSHLFSPGLWMTERGRLSKSKGLCTPAFVCRTLLQRVAISIPWTPSYRFLHIGLLQRPLLREGLRTAFTAKGSRWLHRAPHLPCTGQ